VLDGGCWVETDQTNYLTPRLRVRRVDARPDSSYGDALLGAIPPQDNFILLKQGDLLLLTRDLKPGCPARIDSHGRVLSPATIGCTVAEAIDDLRPGEPIWFDDGRIGGVIEDLIDGCASVRITHAGEGGTRLYGERGINLPESTLRTPALTDKDRSDLSFVAQHADMVGLSFVNRVEDIYSLQAELVRMGERRPAIVLKIETQRGFQSLPTLLLAAMRRTPCGVMIARGDLAVECGFDRLAEIQEELLWLCEAAHVPVIWATQVLDSLAFSGTPSRAEITDAAIGHRAECVMLNRDSRAVAALDALDNILQRMQGREHKRSIKLSPLQLAHTFSTEPLP